MSEIAERYRRVAGRFTARVNEVPDDAWDNPAPCAGWVARDVVRHLVDWFPAFLAAADGPALPARPSVDEDPAGAWAALDSGVQALLDDPVASATVICHPRAGTHRLDDAISAFFLGDVVVHTWDLARATGLDETLDPEMVHDMLVNMEPLDDMLRASGQYGPRVAVAADADEQTRLIAFTGRQP
jgi:uncharacterized protein (TIGR03086 family)